MHREKQLPTMIVEDRSRGRTADRRDRLNDTRKSRLPSLRRKDGERAMNVQVQPVAIAEERRLPFERVALVLQGGGALGAYQAGVYEALAEADIHPNWIAGVSIGAINAALIAGNPPKDRVDRLREFWTQVISGGRWPWVGDPSFGVMRGDIGRNFLNQMSASLAIANGARGLRQPRDIAGPDRVDDIHEHDRHGTSCL
jgi:hypothetical protein